MTPRAPALYSETSSAVGLIFTSGQIPGDAKGFVPESMSEQVHQAFDKLEDVLRQSGSSLANVLQVTVYLLDIVGDFEIYNAVYRERMLPHATPARTTVQVATFRGDKRIELQAIASASAV